MSARKKAPVVDAVFLHFVIEDAVGDVDVARGLMNVAAGTGEGLFQPGFLKQAHFLVKAEGRGVRTSGNEFRLPGAQFPGQVAAK